MGGPLVEGYSTTVCILCFLGHIWLRFDYMFPIAFSMLFLNLKRGA